MNRFENTNHCYKIKNINMIYGIFRQKKIQEKWFNIDVLIQP